MMGQDLNFSTGVEWHIPNGTICEGFIFTEYVHFLKKNFKSSLQSILKKTGVNYVVGETLLVTVSKNTVGFIFPKEIRL